MSDLFELLTPQTILLTPNRRLSAVFLKKYNASQIAAGKLGWLSLDMLPLTRWVKRLWQEYCARAFTPIPLLLNPEQEQIIWENILRQAPENKNLLQVSATAELARAAWGTLKQWQVDFSHPNLQTTEDGMAFQRWAQQFAIACNEQHWLDTHSLTDAVILKIRDGEIRPPQHLLLAGFTEVTPQHQALLESCKAVGTDVTIYQPPSRNNTVARIGLTDEETEIFTMARWAKALHDKNPAASICCVVPSLENLRTRILANFSAVFADNTTYVLDHTILPFNISAGKSLAQYPVIHIALQILKLAKSTMSLADLSNLIRSPFIVAAESEQFARAELVKKLYKNNTAQISLQELIHHAEIRHCPQLREALLAVLASFPAKKIPQPLSLWVNTFMQRLHDIGWPGERSLNSPEYQTAETWLKILAGFISFEQMLGPVNYNDALHYLTYLTTAQIYQPESPETNIQILGALEAAEIAFDYLWVMGLDDTNWPQAPKPNPFIPQRLQKTLNMPHATAERELAFTQELTAQLRRGGDTVIFSYSLQLEDMQLRVSPIITDIPEITVADLTLAEYHAPDQQIFAARSLEILQDDIAPAIGDTEKVSGGTSIFKNQAACPFKAFAVARLKAKRLEPVTLGLRPTERGSILHKALELLWLTLGDQRNLLALDEKSLQELIKRCIDDSIQENAANKNNSNRYYLRLEAERLQKIMIDWLAQEKQRPPFKIKSLEQKQITSFGNIPLTVCADRIDELTDSQQVIIDYKTSKQLSIKAWYGARPDEPQLPLYCVLNANETTAILFARLNPLAMKWEGVSDTQLDIKGVKTTLAENGATWSQQIGEWRQTLANLAADFYRGNASVDPKSYPKTCKQCHLQTLCRIHETINA
jgi:ATP-dependent helicase/nuclease subunit B